MSFQVGIPTVLSSKSPWILDPWAWAMPPYQVVKSGKYFWAMVLSRLFHAAACLASGGVWTASICASTPLLLNPL